MQVWSAFEYLYRDAGNFKAFGCVLLDGEVTPADEETVRSRLESGEFFIAEQVGVPVLYERLYAWSAGPTSSDHCWHEFIGFRKLSTGPHRSAIESKSDFIERFAQLDRWEESLSPHFLNS